MFNKKKEKEMKTKKVWLVIEKNVFSNFNDSYSVAKKAHSLDEAIEYKLALTKLNDRDNQSYFLASDVDTILANVTKHHNKSVENGTYYDNHPEIDKKKDEVVDDIIF